MNTLQTRIALALLVAVSASAVATTPAAKKAPEISIAQARAIALKAAPGKVTKQEREKENGSMRYSLDIQQGDKIHEIGVDVVTGKIVEDKFESAANRD